MKYVLACLLSLFTLNAIADTLYKCTDSSGNTLFTNQRVSNKRCVVLSQESSSRSSGASSSSSANRSPRATPSPNDFPRVSNDTQRGRDHDRRTILEQELATEQQNLDEARKTSNANKVQLHERNIVALKKEIANLK